MKMKLRKFDEFINERLSPDTYRSAADIVDKKGQKDLASKFRSHSRDIERHGKLAFTTPLNFKVFQGYDHDEGESIMVARDLTSRAIRNTWIGESDPREREVWEEAKKGNYETEDMEMILLEYDCPDELILVFTPKDKHRFVNNIIINLDWSEEKQQLYMGEYLYNKLANRAEANKLITVLSDLYVNDPHADNEYSFRNWIDEKIVPKSEEDSLFPGSDFAQNTRKYVDIRTLY